MRNLPLSAIDAHLVDSSQFSSRHPSFEYLKADCQAERHAMHVMAKHIAHHCPRTGDDDGIRAAVEFQTHAQRGEFVEAEHPGTVAEVMRVGELQHVAHRL